MTEEGASTYTNLRDLEPEHIADMFERCYRDKSKILYVMDLLDKNDRRKCEEFYSKVGRDFTIPEEPLATSIPINNRIEITGIALNISFAGILAS